MTLQNEPFEELLSAQLSKQLEPQRGRAMAAFKAQLAAEAAATAGGSPDKAAWARGQVSRKSAWLWVAGPSLAAAALAVAVTLHFARVTPTTGGNPGVQVADSQVLGGRTPETTLSGNSVAQPITLAGYEGNAPGVRVINGVSGSDQAGQNAGFTVIRLSPPDQAYPLNPLVENH